MAIDHRLEKFERAFGVERLRRQALDADESVEVPTALHNARNEYQRLIAEARIATAQRQRLLDGLRYAAVLLLGLAVVQAIFLRFARREVSSQLDSNQL